MKRVLIFEPSAGGHQLYHVRLIAAAAQAAGLLVTVATTEAALAHASALKLHGVLEAGGGELLVTRPAPGAYALAGRLHPVLQQQFSQTAALRAALAGGGQERFAQVFIPFFDAFMTYPLALGGNPSLGIPMSGILHRTRFHMPAMGIRTPRPLHVRAERYAYAAMLRRAAVDRLFTMDPYLDRYYGNDRVKYLPDPGTFAPTRAREAVRAELGIAPGQLAILAYGALDSRKAIDTLLRGVAALPQPERVVVVVAGKQDPTVRRALMLPEAERLRALGILREVPGFVEDEVVDNLFLAADVIWVCYLNSDGNSGVLMKAGQAERPVIAPNTGLSARMVTDDQIGWQADPADPAVVTATIAAILADEPGRMRAAAAIKRRFQSHTVENFVAPIVEQLRLPASRR